MSLSPSRNLAGWILDERKAYRQIGILPEHRRFSVIALFSKEVDDVVYFVMIAHSFGLVSAVYNFNRRAAAVTEILVKLFGLVCLSFYDDRYGIEYADTIDHAHETAIAVHTWLGILFDQHKLCRGEVLDILGVTFDFGRSIVDVKADRRKELADEINAILGRGLLEPGHAAKLKDKLMFASSQLYGKVGRAFLRALSERQAWAHLLDHGRRRQLSLICDRSVELVIFTDGWVPDVRLSESGSSQIGAIVFDVVGSKALVISEAIPPGVIERWNVRKTQIHMVELFALVLIQRALPELFRNKRALLMMDSDSALGALVTGYSAKYDASALGVSWYADRVPTDGNPADAPSRDSCEE
eukprot:5722717-Amphidinium_carterae.1